MSTLLDLPGITLPIIQAPMAGSQKSALALAVGSAGGLGSLPCAMLDGETMRREIAVLQAQQRPYNLNFFCHTPPAPDREGEARWRARLAPYAAELGVEAQAASQAPARAPFSAEIADVVEAFRPAVVSFHFGLPEPALLARVRQWGARVLASATTVDEARWLAARGVDAVIAQGLEAGGHRGHFLSDDLTRQSGLFALLPQIVAAVEVPVIAAGGIADARGVRAALALGAVAAQIGSAYLLCPEAETSAVHRQALRSEAARHTAITTLFSGRPARGIVNRLMRELGPLSADAPAFPLASAALAPLRAAAEARGSGDFSPLWCGQHPPRTALPAAALTRQLAAA